MTRLRFTRMICYVCVWTTAYIVADSAALGCDLPAYGLVPLRVAVAALYGASMFATLYGGVR